MTGRTILHMLSPLKHVSPFDINMALDAGFDVAVPYPLVELGEIAGLIQDAIFSRSPDMARQTAAFIAGKDAALALDMLDAARQAMVPPFAISVFADPAGSFTTAAAMVAKVEKHLAGKGIAGWGRVRTTVFGATGVVGFAAAVIAGLEGAQVTLAGYDGATRVAAKAAEAKRRFGVDLAFADASSARAKRELVAGAQVVLAAGRAGVEILSAEDLAKAPDLLVAADVNAVPPAGIAGIGMQDDGVALGGAALGVGPLAIGGVKYRVEQQMFRAMLAAERPVYLDFRAAFDAARTIVRGA